MLEDLALSTLRLSIPLIFAAYGGMLCERSGIANIALEALLLVSAFAAAAVTAMSGNLIFGVASGLAAGALLGGLFAAICIWGRGDQIVVGTALNLFAMGVIPVLCKALFDVTGSTPSLGNELTFHQPWVFFVLALALFGFLEYLFRFTRHGLRIRAAGENPNALLTQGISYKRLRLRAVIEGSLIVSVGGIYLSLGQGSGYIRDMAAGRGFIALAALIFGAWKPLPTLLACLFFALTDAIQIQMQGKVIAGFNIPNQFVQIMPFVATLAVLVFYSRRMRAPSAINRDVTL